MSPIPSGGLEVPLSLIFSCEQKRVIDTVEEFVENFYSFEYSDNLDSNDDTNDSDDKEDNEYQIITLEMENAVE